MSGWGGGVGGWRKKKSGNSPAPPLPSDAATAKTREKKVGEVFLARRAGGATL